MMNAWKKTSWTDAGQIFEFIGKAIQHDGTEEALKTAPAVYFGGLLAEKKLREAVFFVGHALPRYEGVVWAAQTLLAANLLDRKHPLANAILRWIDDPDEDLRRTVKSLSESEDSFAPMRMLAMAVFTSGGSISQPDLPPVLATADASAKYATGAILTAAYASSDPNAIMRQAAEIGESMASQAA
jgi:hypothetical protein